MALKFTLQEMQTTLDNAIAQKNIYSGAIAKIEQSINTLSSSWVSDEIGTYQTFVDKYNEKKQSLIDAADYMSRFCTKLDEKITEFDETATAINNSFE